MSLFASPLPHGYDYFQRQATYEWFNQWLMNGQGDTEEVTFEDAPEQSLWCTSTGQVLTSLGGRQVFQVNHDHLLAARALSKKETRGKTQIQKELRELLNLPSESEPLHAETLSSKTFERITVEEFQYLSEPGIRVPGWFLKPAGSLAKAPVLLIVETGGRDGLFDRWALVEQACRAGIAVCSVDLRTWGDTLPRFPSAGPLFYQGGVEQAYAMVNLSLGSPLAGQQVYDLVRCLDFLESRGDVDASRIAVAASGTAGLVCIAGAVLDPRIQALWLSRTLVDFESVVAAKEYDLPLPSIVFGLLLKMDLPEMCASLAPRPVCLMNTIGPNGGDLALSDVAASYQVTTRAYADEKQSEKFSLRVAPEPTDEAALVWAKKVLL